LKRKPKICFVSLGCPKNSVDSEKALGALLSQGAVLETDPARADWIIVNTCGFIESAKRESVDTFLELAAQCKKGAQLVLAGCLPSRYGDQLAELMPEASFIISVLNQGGIRELERAVFGKGRAPGACGFATGPRLPIGPYHRAYLRISEGCSNRCAYCAIPAIRGPLRSRPRGQILAEARELARSGVQEIILIGQDTTNYGFDIDGKRRLPELLEEIASLDLFEWIRLMYAHPAHMSGALVKSIARTAGVLHYLDLPLQHINDKILERMGRRVTRARIERTLEMLKSRMGDIAVRTTFIVGFPGETPAQFDELMDFVEKWKFDHVGVFTYSQEDGTRAADMGDHVKRSERTHRRRLLMETQQRLILQKNEELVGRRMTMLVDGFSDRVRRPLVARSYREAPEVDSVVFLDKGTVGGFVEAEIDGVRGYDLTARMLREL